MHGRLFEVAILEHPTKEAADKGETSKLVFGPKAVVAANEQGALVAALLDGERPNVDMQRAEVLVRPFVSGLGESQRPKAETGMDRIKRDAAQITKSLLATAAAPQFSERGLVIPGADYSNVTYGAAPSGRSFTGAALNMVSTGTSGDRS